MKQMETNTFENSPQPKLSEDSNFTTQLVIPNIIYLLKNLSSDETPLSAGDIKQYMVNLTGRDISKRTILRSLQLLSSLHNNPEEIELCNSLLHTFGGKVIEVTAPTGPTGSQVRYKYYFEPLLSPADVSLICSSITSNRYLTPAEKKFLISREKTLTIFPVEELNKEKSQQLITPAELSEKPSPSFPHAAAPMPSNLLHHVNLLHDAIENDYQIILYHGRFTMNENSKSIQFQVKKERKYILNPYALLWNGGAYYLLATDDDYDHPIHFRVDRIQSVEPLRKEDGTLSPRDPLPETLIPFFKTTSKNHSPEFDVAKYTATYPNMRIFKEENFIDCVIECTSKTLSILVDAFGIHLRIKKSECPHPEEDTIFYAVTIRAVQYENILHFCLQHHTALTVLEPSYLVNDVKVHLQKSLDKYR